MTIIKKAVNYCRDYFLRKEITLTPDKELFGKIKGWILISYIINPFIHKKRQQSLPISHTNWWECTQIAKTFLDLGYGVDVINWDNKEFTPKKKYIAFIDIHSNIERLYPYLNNDCIKILHITGAHWLFQNEAEYNRLLKLKERRGVTLFPKRTVPPSLGIEFADFATILGNDFTVSTFSYAKKPIYKIPISSSIIFDFPKEKNFEYCKKSYLWFGGLGMVHKGLDLVLEVFKLMPDYNLFVCGPVKDEKDFEKAFYKELYQTRNIKTIGWVDIGSQDFRKITNNCIGFIYPSCSEGQAGSVVVCMHAGLIPIISYESGVDVGDFGILLKGCSVEEIQEKITKLSELSIDELKNKSYKAWEYARSNHTREKFSNEYRNFVKNVLKL